MKKYRNIVSEMVAMFSFQMNRLNRYVVIILVFKNRNCSLLDEKLVVCLCVSTSKD